MKLSISNIGWSKENDLEVYRLMNDIGFEGLEIAPTRIFPEKPYDNLKDAARWSKKINREYGFDIPSIQSIWNGRKEKLFGTKKERDFLSDYTKKAINFAETIGCKNLVFGCPINRNKPECVDENIDVVFFKKLGEYAVEHNTVLAIEANPTIYNTNYINDTLSAINLIEKVNSKGFLLNLDIGTMIENNEPITILQGKEHLINHIHISEPWLKVLEKRDIHKQLSNMLKDFNYQKYVSIEIEKQSDIKMIQKMMYYVKEIFDE